MTTKWVLVSEDGEYCGVFTPQEVKSRFIRYMSKKKLYTDGENLYQVIVLPEVKGLSSSDKFSS